MTPHDLKEQLKSAVTKTDLEHEVELQIKGKKFVDEALLDAKFEIWRSKMTILLEGQFENAEVTKQDLTTIQIEVSYETESKRNKLIFKMSNIRQAMMNLENNFAPNVSPSQNRAPDIVPMDVPPPIPVRRAITIPRPDEIEEDLFEPIPPTNENNNDNNLFNKVNDKIRHVSKKMRKIEKALNDNMSQAMEQVSPISNEGNA